MTTASPNERSDLVELVLAAFKARPPSWSAVLAIGRAVRPHLQSVSSAPIVLAEGHRRGIARLLPTAATPQEEASARALRRVMIFLVELCAHGPAQALALCVDDAASLPDAAAIFLAVGRFLDQTGLGRHLTDADMTMINSRFSVSAGRSVVLTSGLAMLGLSGQSPLEERTRAFVFVALPRMREAARRGDFDTMTNIEAVCYNGYIKTVETPEHHTRAFAAIESAYALAPSRPALHAPTPSVPPRVAFIIPNGNILAHSEVLLAFLAGLKQMADPPMDPGVVIYSAAGGELSKRLDQLGVAWDAVGPPSQSRSEHFDEVARRIAAFGADSVVFVSLPQYLAYFVRRPLANIQIWWSMKFALPNFEQLDGRVFYRSLFDRQVEIAGRMWRGGPLAFTAPAPAAKEAVAAIRARFEGKVILGTIAREEKIANDDYLAAVVDILRRHPDAVFLWTGREQPQQVLNAFAAGGVADRCHFIGWVDPIPYIEAFDLFLETYPLTGLMSGWAMALGKPIISVGSLGFLASYLEPVLDGSIKASPEQVAQLDAIFQPIKNRLPGIWAQHPRDMARFADLLLADAELLRTFGEVQRAYVETYMSDEVGSSAIQARHFAEIVAQRRQSSD